MEEETDICSMCAIIGCHNTHTQKIITKEQLKNYIDNMYYTLQGKMKSILGEMPHSSIIDWENKKIKEAILSHKNRIMGFYMKAKENLKKYF